MQPFVVPFWIDRSAPVAVYLFALSKGGVPERLVAGLSLALWTYSNVIHPHWLGQMLGFHLVASGVQLALLTTLALRYDRWWLLVAAMAVLLQAATDVADIIRPVQGWAFGTVMWTWNWIYVAAVATGTWRSRRHAVVQVRQTTWATLRSRRSAEATSP